MLEKLASKHHSWVKMAISLGCPEYLTNDVVQEVYVRMHKYRKVAEPKVIDKDGNINSFYMFGAIRNTFCTLMKSESKYQTLRENVQISDDSHYQHAMELEAPEDVDLEFEERFQELMDKIQVEVDSWGAYNSKLFNLYFKTDLSMRKIAKGTDIGLTHIFSSITKYRASIQEKFSEDFINLKETE